MSGFCRWYGKDICSQFNQNKLDAFRDLVESTQERLIVFYSFNDELWNMKKICQELDRPISEINGHTKDLTAYEQESNSVTLCQYQSASKGLNLQKCNRIIYFSLPLSSEDFEQSKKKLLFFKSTDKKNWTYMNFVTKDNGFGWMWECPDYFQTDGEQILIFSPMDFNKGGKSYSDQSICMKVMFQKETCHMEMPDTYQYLDYGLDLYAPQTTVDEAGRRVLLAWLRMPKPVDGQWSGMQCIPRVIEVKNDHIYFRVHPNIRNAFSKKINSPDEADENGYRVSFSLEDGETVDIGGYQITRKGNKIHTDRGRLVDTSWEMQTEFSTPDLKDGFQIDVYVDPNLIEVFVNDGEYIISNCVYNLGTDIHQQGNVKYEMYTLEGTDVSEV